MKRIYLTLCGVVIAGCLFGQKLNKDLESLIQAEKNFAWYSREFNTRDAFLNFMSDKGIVFSKGNELNAKEIFSQRQPSGELLSWEPVFADISNSGDFGFTTGPYKLFLSRTDTMVAAAHGYFSTVWEKNEEGKWKALIDLGIVYPAEEKEKPAFSISKATKVKISSSRNAFNDLTRFERSYLEQINEENRSFNPNFFSEEAKLYRPGLHPIRGLDKIREYMEDGSSFTLEQIGGKIASSGDLAFTYGKVMMSNTWNGTSRKHNGNYLHVWKKEDGKNWKLVLDVIGI